jgi:hypothetical protein
LITRFQDTDSRLSNTNIAGMLELCQKSEIP